jgi:hypothetical protein
MEGLFMVTVSNHTIAVATGPFNMVVLTGRNGVVPGMLAARQTHAQGKSGHAHPDTLAR